MNTIQKRFSEPKTEDILYDELLSKKLAKLPLEQNMQAKHKMVNLMFRLSMIALKQNQPYPPKNKIFIKKTYCAINLWRQLKF